MSVADFALLGRLHPLVLHFPIGLLFGALLTEWLVARGKVTRGAQSALLACAALAAVVTASTGWVLSHEEGYESGLVESHERLGIAVALAAVLAALVHLFAARSAFALRSYQLLLGVACATLVLAGHLGSEITHGEDWLEGPRARGAQARTGTAVVHQNEAKSAALPALEGKSDPDPALSTPTKPSSPPDVYAERIAPILAERCSSCHGPTKHKGHLRLDTREGLLAGGEDGPVLVPGDPAASLLFQRASLPLDHEDHMPPEGKPQPTSEELEALREWIASGAPFGAESAKKPEEPEPGPAEEEPAPKPAGPRGPPSDALGALERALIHHELADPESGDLRIDVAPVAQTFGDAEVHGLLLPLAPWTAELVLGRSAIGDGALKELAGFPRLRHLDLRATRVSAAGLAALAAAPALEELNLAQVKLGDEAVEVLLGLPHLRKLVVWNSGLTPAGLERLRASLEVEAGDEPESEALEREGALTFTSDRPPPGAESVPEALRPVNSICPVSGNPVNPKYALVYTSASGTRVIGFCCPNCPKDFWADPAKFEAKLP